MISGRVCAGERAMSCGGDHGGRCADDAVELSDDGFGRRLGARVWIVCGEGSALRATARHRQSEVGLARVWVSIHGG